MSSPLLLRAFVKERLTAAAEEIFQVFEKTIEKYEEEASSSKQEIDRLRGLLLEFVSKQKDISHLSICKDETRPESNFSVDQRKAENRHVKEEDQEVWTNQQQQEQEEEEDVGEFKDADVLYLPHSSVSEQDDVKPSLQPQTQNRESDEQIEETAPFVLSFASSPSSQTRIQTERIQDGLENERSALSFMSNQTQIEERRDSTELTHLNSVAPNYHCYLCDKSFSSNHHLINHAFRIHSKDAGFLCAVCGKTLESSENLNTHLQSHKGSKCCNVCGKNCSSSTSLAEHMASHNGVKLHRCHVCGKECSRKGDLKIHMRIHTGEKPFCCSYCCKSFTHSGHLRKHMRTHTGERPHQCLICGKGFLQSAHLKYHLGTHTKKY